METERTDTQIIEHSIRDILSHIGENPARPGLVDTPARIVKMWREIFRGYDERQKPEITTFQNGADGLVYDSMIIDSGTFYSMCEHHAMPFFGTYHFAYIPHPEGKILGLSKIARTVDYYSARLQIQERLVSDIVNEIEAVLGIKYPPPGVALIMKGEHLCKTMRGVKKQGQMTSSSLTGLFKTESAVRNEFLQLVKPNI
ncbi:MAG: GTP cyclohydrolase I [Tannerella sp.]|jgi:GTP cyclohydrolase I|nr:GTP cyclohydrolase I [Tannerella sp.]